MPTRNIGLLPKIFQTEDNRKFINATLDQVTSDPDLKRVNGYIGRRLNGVFSDTDNYIREPSTDRQHYQLEPAVTAKISDDNFTGTYVDFINKLRFNGANINDHSRMFANEYYTYDSQIDYDKFVNFSQYYWMPNGPATVFVGASAIPVTDDINVTRVSAVSGVVSAEGYYQFSSTGSQKNPLLILVRGGTYKFNVSQPGNRFWIQTEPGISGVQSAQPNFSSREVFGVVNNGEDDGQLVFNVPSTSAQDFYINMTETLPTNFAVSGLSYADIQGQYLSQFISLHGGIDGNDDIEDKTLLFVDNSTNTNDWTATSTYTPLSGFTEFGTNVQVPQQYRTSVWKVKFEFDAVQNDYIIHLVVDHDILQNNKTKILEGNQYSNRYFYKNVTNDIELIPLITVLQDTFYYQDENDPAMVGVIKIIDANQSYIIDVKNDIVGKKSYTSPNGVEFSTGMKIKFDANVTPADYANETFYVEGVGTAIKLVNAKNLITPEDYIIGAIVEYDTTPYDIIGYEGNAYAPTQPDYITINRASIDGNPWSRSNRWFHIDVIKKSAEYANFDLALDQAFRAKRPIIEFDESLQLFNYGSEAVFPVTLLDTTETDALSNVESAPVPHTVDGIELKVGMRVIFANDASLSTRTTIFEVEHIDPDNDGNYQIHLVPASDSPIREGNSFLVIRGVEHQAQQYHYVNGTYILSQQKTDVNQPPVFDVFTRNNVSISDSSVYDNSSFAGTKLFSYAVNSAGVDDPVLGFPLKYKNLGSTGDIVFENNYDADTFTYTKNNAAKTSPVSIGWLRKNKNRTEFEYKNIWQKVDNESRQMQIIEHAFNGSNRYEIDILPEPSTSIKNFRVFVDSKELALTDFHHENYQGADQVVIDVPLSEDTKLITIKIYSKQVSKIGWYELPSNLENNAQNKKFSDLTLGQIRNHVIACFDNSIDANGIIPGVSNLRDSQNILSVGGTILQHSAGLHYAMLFTMAERFDFFKATTHAANAYESFKYKFLDLAATMELPLDDIPAATDAILEKINDVKTPQDPWYASDMLPYGPDKTITTYTVIQLLNKQYETVSIFNDTELSNKALLVYVNGKIVRKDADYTIVSRAPFIEFTDSFQLQLNDEIKIVEYNDTTECWVPETPSKLGLYPSFIPEVFTDDTYIDPVVVIKGHDGSITPAFGDYRDDLLFELETRIYSNIKAEYNQTRFNLDELIPGKFRDTEYDLSEFNAVMAKFFFEYVGKNRLDYRTNFAFDANNGFTYNYEKFASVLDNSTLEGSWKAIYEYYYDTTRPHTAPWELLGFSKKPNWWENYYGPAPYTSGNLVLWNDLEAGIIRDGERAGTYDTYARPGLTSIIPVDQFGNLLSPDEFLVTARVKQYANKPYKAGQQGPVEAAWRKSSSFPYAMQMIIALLRPAEYFGLNININDYDNVNALQQYLYALTNSRLQQSDIQFPGRTAAGINNNAGYINWIADYLRSDNIDSTTVFTEVFDTMNIQLAYKVGGFTDKKFMKVLASQSSPTSTSSSIVLPDEDYDIVLSTSTPMAKVGYSSVIIEKTANGFRVDGYNFSNPHFAILPTVPSNKETIIKVGDSSVSISLVHSKTAVSVPYGYEFTSVKQVVEFLVSYGKWLEAQGFLFDEFDQRLGDVKNWTMSAKEFLYWKSQGWQEGNVIVLNPMGNKLAIRTPGAVIAEIKPGSPNTLLDQNFNPLRNAEFSVSRIDNDFSIKILDGRAIGFIELSVIQFEHMLVFNNKTVFNDVIYQPELGNRQLRLKLVGFISDNWNGSLNAAGFVYNDNNVPEWQQQKDYRRGDLVQYKSRYFYANDNIAGETEFDYNKWTLSSYGENNIGLIPNFANKAKAPEDYYETEKLNLESDFDLYGKGLIGYRNRSYFYELGLDDTSQVKFYQGAIAEKGTHKAINALTRARLEDTTSRIEMFEEWALRVGEYGALDSTAFIEVVVDEKEATDNPALLVFKNSGDTKTPSAINYYPADIYNTTVEYDKNFLLNETTDYSLDYRIKTAGSPLLGETDYQIYSIDYLSKLNEYTDIIGVGDSVWVAKDVNSDWNVYRVENVGVKIISVQAENTNAVTIHTDNIQPIAVGDKVLVRSINEVLDGWHIVTKIIDQVTFEINLSPDGISDMTDLSGQLYKLKSVRYDNTAKLANALGTDIRSGEKVYIDEIEPNVSGVYNKNTPWQDRDKVIPSTLYTDTEYGHAVEISSDDQIVYVGQPKHDQGKVNILNKTNLGNHVTLGVLEPNHAAANEFGYDVSVSDNKLLAVSAPDSIGGAGVVYLYYYDPLRANSYVFEQALVVSTYALEQRYGEEIELSSDGNWLFVSRRSTNAVDVYGRVKTDGVQLDSYDVTPSTPTNSFTLSYTPASINELSVVDSEGKVYYPYVDYTLSGNVISFISPFVFPVSNQLTIDVSRHEYTFEYNTSITIPGLDTTALAYSINANPNASELTIGVPLTQAKGKTFVFDRSVEIITLPAGNTVLITDTNFDDRFVKVFVDGAELMKGTDYTTSGISGTITFTAAYSSDVEVTVHTNTFTQVQELITSFGHVDDLFGYDASMCPKFCSVAVGMPNYDKSNIQTNTGRVIHYTNQSRKYGIIKGMVQNPTVTIGNKIRVNDRVVTFTGTTLLTVVNDINALGLIGVTAYDEDGYLVIKTDSKEEFNKLRISPAGGSNSGLTELGLVVYAQTNVIESPIGLVNEKFGESVLISDDAVTLIVGSSESSTILRTTFDNNTTTFDGDSTRFGHIEIQSGSVTVFEYLPVTNESIEQPGAFAYAQQLTGTGITTGDRFGKSVAATSKTIVVGAPSDDINNVILGSVYTYENDNKRAWELVRQKNSRVDINSINKVYLYNKDTQTIVDVVDYLDPVKGKILGQAAQEIDYITEYDPAHYSVTNSNDFWSSKQVGTVWWDLSTCRFIDYEQSDLSYRVQNWGKLFPGSTVDVYEWIESEVPPAEYTGDGQVKNIDEYTVMQLQDDSTGVNYEVYYFWVKNRITVDDVRTPRRTMTTKQITSIIEDPKSQGTRYVEFVRDDAIVLVNALDALEANNIVLHVDYDIVPNDNNIHSEYALVGEGSDSQIPQKTINKIIDSLSGIDAYSNEVPDTNLPVSQRYGTSIRPRQSMVISRVSALRTIIESINDKLAKLRIFDIRTMPTLYSKEELPSTSEYNVSVTDYDALQQLDISTLPQGYKVLVNSDYTNNNFWAIYILTGTNWVVHRIQAFNTPNYWSTIDWYREDINPLDLVIDITVNTPLELYTIQNIENGAIIKINNNGNGQWEIIEKTPAGFVKIGMQNATLQISKSLYVADDGAGYDTANYDLLGWDSAPQEETRRILFSVFNEIFIDDLNRVKNDLFFVFVRYVLAEQKNVDWIFKTSFISIDHTQARLDQYPIYRRSNQTYLQDYINEMKPYRTKIREYLVSYEKLEPWQGDVTDFDLPAYYDFNLNRFRSPDGSETEDNEILTTKPEYKHWLNNHKYGIGSIEIIDGGAGYSDSTPPAISIVGNGTGAKAKARVLNGGVVEITILDAGYGYTEVPDVILDYNASTPAKVIARLENKTTRKISIDMRFDRVLYDTNVQEWAANTTYNVGDIVVYNNNPFKVHTAFTSDANGSFEPNNVDLVSASFFDNANDRTMAYYAPRYNMPGKDLSQLFTGIDYPGLNVTSPIFGATDPSDTIIDAGDLTTNYSGSPAGIIYDGGAFVSEYTSHAPEELVPGAVFDTYNIEVYNVVGADYEGDGANTPVQYRTWPANGSQINFIYALPDAKDTDYLFVYTYNTGAKYEGIDYTVDRVNKVLNFNTPPANGDTVIAFVTDHAVTGLVTNDVFVGDGTTTDFTVNVPSNMLYDVFVTVDAVRTAATFTSTSPGITTVSLSMAPANGSRVHIKTLFNLNIANPVSEIQMHEYAANTNITSNVTFENEGPYAAKIIVEKNNTRLIPPAYRIWKADGARVEWGTPNLRNGLDSSNILASDIDVYVNGQQLASNDWTLEPQAPGDIGFRRITTATPAPAGAELVIELRTQAEYYTIGNNQIAITAAANLQATDTIRVYTWSNHDIRRITTIVYDIAGGNVVTLPYAETVPEGFDVSPFDTVSMDGPVIGVPQGVYTNPAYLWVTLNGVRLYPDLDYVIDPATSELTLLSNVTVGPNDVLVVTAFTENLISPRIAYRIFSDISGKVEYLRIAEENSTRLAAPVLRDDTYIVVDDITALAVPNPTQLEPGVVFINGERITYYGMGATGPNHPHFPNMPANSIWQLWRGTHGTGVPDEHSAGEQVVDASARQLVPNTANARIDSVLHPWASWSVVVNTMSDLLALDVNNYVEGAKALVLMPDPTVASQQVFVLDASQTWQLVESYTDKIWMDPGISTPANGQGLQSATTDQAEFLKARPGPIPDII